MKKHEVTVTIPATSANLGSGFDCLGMSLDIWNDVSIAVSSSPEVYISGEGSEEIFSDTDEEENFDDPKEPEYDIYKFTRGVEIKN
mgnify:CR=1 FL=1